MRDSQTLLQPETGLAQNASLRHGAFVFNQCPAFLNVSVAASRLRLWFAVSLGSANPVRSSGDIFVGIDWVQVLRWVGFATSNYVDLV